ncbi:MAG: peptidoglycan DD-metalloendopeptidase family protein [Deltaproteobacteria bacterium]|nr:peptidoglycan DD-metalloendopeptidase family protein [Deltaproteobacteria bacterium]
MDSKFTLYLFHGKSPYPRRLSLSPKILAAVAVFLLVAAVSTGYLVHEYSRLKDAKEQARAMQELLANQKEALKGQKSTILSQQKELVDQREQMEFVARQLNEVRDNLADLKEFEKKIRIITDIDRRVVNKKGLGVGGGSTRDFPSRLSLNVSESGGFKDVNQMAGELASVSLEQEAQFGALLKRLEDQQRELNNTVPSMSPVNGEISSVFGYRVSPFSSGWELHKGIDISAPTGTPVAAPAAGVVSFAGRKSGYGNAIMMDHGKSTETLYGHLSAILVREGSTVKKGDIIGLVGSTGQSTGPHLHYEVRLNGNPVNPEKYMRAA